MSHLIASATLSIPTMILGETALSFLGLGLRPPITSWGVLLTEAQNINAVELYPWIMTPVIPVVLVVLAFNFFGDGLRDAADPYRKRRERRRSRGVERRDKDLVDAAAVDVEVGRGTGGDRGWQDGEKEVGGVPIQ